MFYIVTKDLNERTRLIEYLKDNGIQTAFHYVPLHSSKAGRKYGRFNGADNNTTRISESLLRLPMYYGLEENDIEFITDRIKDFYRE